MPDIDLAIASCERRLAHAKRVTSSLRLVGIEREICKNDPVHWANHYLYGHDPREGAVYVPLDTFPKQAEYLEWLIDREEKRECGLVEKARDVGVTVYSCAYAVHGFLFREGFRAGFGSQKLEYVDRLGDPKSIFEKIRFIMRNLPEWMLPRGWDPRKHDNYCRIINPVNGATLTGEGGDDIGRGDRTSIYFLDEAAVVERADMVEAALSQTTNVRIYLSTPRGPGNWFYRKRFSGTLPIFTIRWTDDPRKNDEWLEKQKRDLEPHVVAQEILLDYTASIEGIFIPAAWVRAAIDLDLPASGPIIAGLDIGEEGNDASVLTPRQGPLVTEVVSWGHCNTNQTAHRTIRECRERRVSTLNYDAVGVGTGPKGTWQDMAIAETLPFLAVPIHGGVPASERYWPDGQTSVEKFQDVNGELWWLLRQRFERTFEFVTQGVQHRPEDMISIPDHPELIAQLSMPLLVYNDRGKIGRESKKAMKKRGVKSPDFAESLVYSFNPTEEWVFNGSALKDSPVARLPVSVFNERPRDERGRGAGGTVGGAGGGGGGDAAWTGGGDGDGVDYMNMRF